jgi:hypothetical protein
VPDVRSDRVRQCVPSRGRRREAIHDKQDPARSNQQRCAGTRLIGRHQRRLVELTGNRRTVDTQLTQTLLGQAPQRVKHAGRAEVQSANAIGRRTGFLVVRVHRPEPLARKSPLHVTTDLGDPIRRMRLAPHQLDERLMAPLVIQQPHPPHESTPARAASEAPYFSFPCDGALGGLLAPGREGPSNLNECFRGCDR